MRSSAGLALRMSLNIFEDLGQCRVRITDPESGAYVTLDFGGFHGAKIIEERGAQ
jgi:hypothetical protein